MIKNTKICVFCGQPGNTREHIIPRWLQKHFALKDERLQMQNKTSIQYCRVLLPACKRCNGEIFSRLESKVRDNKANAQEYYLWALKIRYCLSLIDSSLPDDRSNPSDGPILRSEFATIGHEFIKHAFTHLEGEKFFFRPYPFGSVFIIKNPIRDSKFGLVDVSHPYWALTIALPNDRLLCVLFTDRGMVKKSIEKRYKSVGGFSAFLKNSDREISTGLYLQELTFKLLIAQYQISNIPYDVKLKSDGLYSKKLPNKIRYRQQLKENVLAQIADFCGLPVEVATHVYKSQPESYRGL